LRYGLVCNAQGEASAIAVLVYRCPTYRWSSTPPTREKIVACARPAQGTRKIELTDETFDPCLIAIHGPQAVAMCGGRD